MCTDLKLSHLLHRFCNLECHDMFSHLSLSVPLFLILVAREWAGGAEPYCCGAEGFWNERRLKVFTLYFISDYAVKHSCTGGSQCIRQNIFIARDTTEKMAALRLVGGLNLVRRPKREREVVSAPHQREPFDSSWVTTRQSGLVFFLLFFLMLFPSSASWWLRWGSGHGLPPHARRQRSDIHIAPRDLK